jgi:hypothetical protein
MNPGVWAWRDYNSQGSAAGRANLLRKKGFEATTRGVRLYARWPAAMPLPIEAVAEAKLDVTK